MVSFMMNFKEREVTTIKSLQNVGRVWGSYGSYSIGKEFQLVREGKESDTS